MSEIKFLRIQEFIDDGLLHEVNRLLLHPLGLALEIEPLENVGDKVAEFRVWDYRDDPEGVLFADETLDVAKAECVAAEMLERRKSRVDLLGFVIQPVASGERTLTMNYFDPIKTIPQGDLEFEA